MLKRVEQTSKYSISLRTGGEEQLDFQSLFKRKNRCVVIASYGLARAHIQSGCVWVCVYECVCMEESQVDPLVTNKSSTISPMMSLYSCSSMMNDTHIDTSTIHPFIPVVPIIPIQFLFFYS